MTQSVPGSWWQRNWKWAFPVGCGCGCLAPVVLFLTLMTGGLGTAFWAMRSSEPIQHGLTLARQDPQVVEALGEPIEQGWVLSGSMQTSGSSGEADVMVPIKGPRGEGKLHVVAEKRSGEWHYELIQVVISGEQGRINLLTEGSPSGDLL